MTDNKFVLLLENKMRNGDVNMSKVKVNSTVGKALNTWFDMEDNPVDLLLKNHIICIYEDIPWSLMYESFNELSLVEVANIVSNGYEVEKQWYDTKDSLELKGDVDKITLMSNQDTWKDEDEVHPLYTGMKSDNEQTFTGLTLKQMKEVRDYLTHKIDYLES